MSQPPAVPSRVSHDCCPTVHITGGETVQPLRMGTYHMVVKTNPRLQRPPLYLRQPEPIGKKVPRDAPGLSAAARISLAEPQQFMFFWPPWRAWLVGPNFSEPSGGLIGLPAAAARACPDLDVKWHPWLHERRTWDTNWDVGVKCATYRACACAAPRSHVPAPGRRPRCLRCASRAPCARSCCTAIEVRGAEALQPDSMGIFHVHAFGCALSPPPLPPGNTTVVCLLVLPLCVGLDPPHTTDVRASL